MKLVLKNDLGNIKDILYIITDMRDAPNGYEISCERNDIVLKFSNKPDAIKTLKVLVTAFEVGYINGHFDGYVYSLSAV